MADSTDAWRSSRPTPWVARILGPLALIAVLIAAYVIVDGYSDDEESDSPATEVQAGSNGDPDKEGPETPREYEVQAGDSLTSIAEKFGVSVERLERLNPEIDAQTLNEGTPIILR